MYGACAVFGFIGFSAWVLVGDVTSQHALDKDGEFTDSGGDRFGPPQPVGESSVVGAERGLAATQGDGTHS